ncbi:hypothetical protein OUZ56_029212 [Daphnia magna]|uniref:Helicase c-terminal domain containing protein n=1 Tax=Daphnia magna TaxID=35525 RepID=A0ABR0B660_9CRUS|nr:hypothetical protein OUZ56_029212 [Daphnia magna]
MDKDSEKNFIDTILRTVKENEYTKLSQRIRAGVDLENKGFSITSNLVKGSTTFDSFALCLIQHSEKCYGTSYLKEALSSSDFIARTYNNTKTSFSGTIQLLNATFNEDDRADAIASLIKYLCGDLNLFKSNDRLPNIAVRCYGLLAQPTNYLYNLKENRCEQLLDQDPEETGVEWYYIWYEDARQAFQSIYPKQYANDESTLKPKRSAPGCSLAMNITMRRHVFYIADETIDDRSKLLEHLDKHCIRLTENIEQNLTLVESLVLCLIQHSSGNYFLTSLDYPHVADFGSPKRLSESGWNAFRAEIESFSKTFWSKSNENLMKNIKWIIQQLWKRFNCFNVRISNDEANSTRKFAVVVFGFSKLACYVVFKDNEFKIVHALNEGSSPFYVWFDKSNEVFEALAPLFSMYQHEKESASLYWNDLFNRFERGFDQFLKQRFHSCSSSSEVEQSFDDFKKCLKEARDISLSSIQQVFSRWDSNKESIRANCSRTESMKVGWERCPELRPISACMEECLMTLDHDIATSWCKQLWNAILDAIARQVDLELTRRNREIEMARRRGRSKIDKANEKVKQLQKEIESAQRRMAQKQAENKMLDEKLEALAWNQLIIDIGSMNYVPDYQLVLKRTDHEFFKLKNGLDLAETLSKIVQQPNITSQFAQHLKNYVKKSGVDEILEQLRSALIEVVGKKPSDSWVSDGKWRVEGPALVLSQVVTLLEQKGVLSGGKCQEVTIEAERVLYIDSDWVTPGVSLKISAPLVNIVSSGNGTKRVINTSGKDGKPHDSNKANDGEGGGVDGSDGLDGEDGQDAGNITIDCLSMENHHILKLVAQGGNGSSGQSGGDGKSGKSGEDGANGSFASHEKEKKNWYAFGRLRDLRLKTIHYGTSGSNGQTGGSGGNAGCSGTGGQGGEITINFKTSERSGFEKINSNGVTGEQGTPGKGGDYGRGGQHGQDAVYYFEATDSKPWVFFTGNWRKHLGSENDVESQWCEGWLGPDSLIGYKLTKNSSLKFAANGKRGREGERANQRQNQNSRTRKSESLQQRERSANTQSNQTEMEQAIAAQRANQEQIQREGQTISRCTAAIDTQRNRISSVQQEIELANQEITVNEATRQRVKVKIREMLEQHIVHQVVVRQNVTRQVNLQLEDHQLGLQQKQTPINLNLFTLRAGCRSGSNATEPTQILDNLLSSGGSSLSIEDHLKLMKATQMFHLRLVANRQNCNREWLFVGKLIEKYSSRPQRLIAGLEFLEMNQGLMIQLLDRKTNGDILKILRTFLDPIETHDEEDAISTLFEFGLLRDLPYETLKVLLERLELRMSSNNAQLLLAVAINYQMLGQMTREIADLIGDDRETALRCAELLVQVSDLHSLPRKMNETAQMSDDDLKAFYSSFFDELRNQLFIVKESRAAGVTITVYQAVKRFVRRKLGYNTDNLNVEDLSKIQVTDVWRIAFLINEFLLEASEMDAVRQWIRNSNIKNKNAVLSLLEKSFRENILDPGWTEVRRLLTKRENLKNEKLTRKLEEVECATRVTMSKTSFVEKSCILEELKDVLRNEQEKEESILEWVSRKAITVEPFDGFFSGPSGDSEEEIVVNIVEKLDTTTLKKLVELNWRLSTRRLSFDDKQIVKFCSAIEKPFPRISPDLSYDLQYSQSIFRSNWVQYLLNRVADERVQVDRLFASVLKKFEGRSNENGTLALILRKYELYTSTLEPLEASKVWMQLDKMSSIKDVLGEVRSKLKEAEKLLDEVKRAISKLEGAYGKIANAPLCDPVYDIFSLVDRVQQLVTGCTEGKSNSSLFQNGNSLGELFNIMDAVRFHLNIMDIDGTKTKKESETYGKICGLKNAFCSWNKDKKIPQYGGAQEAVKTHERLLISLTDAFSINREELEGEDPRRVVYDEISNHIGEIQTSHDEDLKLIGELSIVISDPRSGIDFCQYVKRTSLVYFSLRPSALSNERKSRLFEAILRVVDIQQQHPVEKNLSGLFGHTLKRASEQNNEWLYTSIALLIGNLLKSEWHLATWNQAELWSAHLELITKKIEKEDFEEACEMLLSIQQHVLDYCRACYIENLLKTTNKSSDTIDLNMANLAFNEAVSLTTDVLRFANTTNSSKPHGLVISQVMARQKVLKTTIRLGLSQLVSWHGNTIIHHLLHQDVLWNKDNEMFKKVISKAFSGNTNAETRRREAFVKRLISLRHVEWTEKRLAELNSLLNKSYQDLSVVVGYDVFTEEERSFVSLIDSDVAVLNILTSEYPSCYLNSLQNLAIKPALESFVRCFLPNFAGISLNQEANFEKEKTDEAQLWLIAKKFLSRKKAEGTLRDWIVWFNDVFIASLNSCPSDSGLTVNQVSNFLDDAANSNLELCRLITTTCRPHYWTRFLAIYIIKNSINRLGLGEAGDATAGNLVAFSMRVTNETGSLLIRCLREKILAESKTDRTAVGLVRDVASGLNEISELNSNIFEDKQLFARFVNAGLTEWPKVCRLARFASKWTMTSEGFGLLSAQKVMTVFDIELGQKRTDRLLDRAQCYHRNNLSFSSWLEKIANNLISFPWIREQCIKLAECSDAGEEEDKLWASVTHVENKAKSAHNKELTVNDILTILSNDPESRLMTDDPAKRTEIRDFVQRAKSSYECEYKNWNSERIKQWSAQVKVNSNSKPLRVYEFLAVASRAVELAKGYKPRDVQMLAVIMFVMGEDRGNKKIKRMAQISTGEGKTLITALLAIYHVLRHWNKDRHVNVITSSSVLAEASVSEIQYLYDQFGVSLSNNCDLACAKDDRLRKERYNSHVIYGDLPSFMRDILLTRFFNKKITRGRTPGAMIVDEVDSMLLDKGESVLYLSHNVPEMYHLRQLFVEIAGTVNAPDVQSLAESRDIVAEVRRFIEPRINDSDIAVPNCLKGYVKLHLSTWIRSALRAAYLLNAKDSYKIDDLGDGKGRQVIIMDKETGVEQIQMEWSDGLHPALQLKHGLKWTPTALKAVFMSNIGFFTEFNGRFYGVTGTLGSAAECDLLRNVFGVDFFRMPRFKQRFCIQHGPHVAGNEAEWLQNMEKAVEEVTKSLKPRAALIICENIFSAERIYEALSKTSQSKKMQHEEEVGPGQVIVATNLAGRGTDFKLSKQLEKNGGLHVIISYVPPNARVEAQAEGRTARSGQPGSYQFVIQEGSGQMVDAQGSTDPYGKLCALKIARDDEERSRLEHLRLNAVPKIKLEESLFERFFRECIKPLRERSTPDETVATIQTEEIDIKIHCLNNRWAIWLDDNAKQIECAHSDRVLSENLNKAFESFISSVGNACWLSLEDLAQTPSEFMCVARFYENHSKDCSDNLGRAMHCCKQIVTKEPLFCENALLEHVRLILLNKADYYKKREAKKLLVNAKKLIDSRIETLTGLNQVVSILRQKTNSGSDPAEHFRFEEQTSNMIHLLQVHLNSISSLLGVPLTDALSRQFHSGENNDEQLNKVNDILARSSNYYKPLRYSKKVQEINETKTKELQFDGSVVKWPSFLSHCQTDLIEWFVAGVKNQKRSTISDATSLLSSLESKIAEGEIRLWNQLIKNGYIDKGGPDSSYTITAVNSLEPELLENFADYKRIIPGWLAFHEEEDFDEVSSTLGITNDDNRGQCSTVSRIKKLLIDNKLLVKSDRPIHKILKNIPSVQDNVEAHLVPGVPLVSCADVLAAWFPSAANQEGQRVEQPDFDGRKTKLADQFKNYLIDIGILKQPAIFFRFPSSNQSKENIDSDLEKMKNFFKSRKDFDDLAWTLYNKEERHAKKRKDILAERLMVAIREHLGQLKTFAQMKSSFVYLHEDLPPSSVNPADELQQFDAQYFDRVGRFEEHIPFDRRILIVALLGVAQLVGAVAFPFFSAGLAVEGINDLMFAFQSFKNPGSFSWSTYAKGKLKGLAMMALTAGFGAAGLIAKGGKNLMGAMKLLGRFNGTLKGWWQLGKQVLAKCADALLSSVIGQIVQKFLNWAKEFILKQVLSRVKSFLFENPVCRPAFEGLRALMNDILNEARRFGRSLGEVRKSIQDAIDRACNPDAPSAIDMFSRIKETANGIRGEMLGAFGSAMEGLANCQQNHLNIYKSSSVLDGITDAGHTGTFGKVIKQTAQVAKRVNDFTKESQKIIKQVNNMQSIVKLAAEPTCLVKDVNEQLRQELRRLNSKQDIDHNQQSMVDLTEKQKLEFDGFKTEMSNKIQELIMKKSLDEIQSAWVQPALQAKLEKTVRDKATKTLHAMGLIKLPPGADNLRDEASQPENEEHIDLAYEERVEKIGEEMAGPVEKQLFADRYGFSLELVDETGDYSDGSGSFSYHPNGDPANKKIMMKVTKNEDGEKHVELIMPDGTTYKHIPGPGESLNSCFYHAAAKALNKSSAEVISEMKEEARSNERVRIMYNIGVNEKYSRLHTGAYGKCSELEVERDELGRKVTVSAVITPANVATVPGSDVKVKEAVKIGLDGENVSHCIPRCLGGTYEEENLVSLPHMTNQKYQRFHEKGLESFCQAHMKGQDPPKIEVQVKVHFQNSVQYLESMIPSPGKKNTYEIAGIELNFHLKNDPSNFYKSGFIPCQSGESGTVTVGGDRFKTHFLRKESSHLGYSGPSNVRINYAESFEEGKKKFSTVSADLHSHQPHNRRN